MNRKNMHTSFTLQYGNKKDKNRIVCSLINEATSTIEHARIAFVLRYN